MLVIADKAQLLCLLAFCLALAQTSSQLSAAPAPDASKQSVEFKPDRRPGPLAELRLASLMPHQMDRGEDASLSGEPFNLPAGATSSGETSAKWAELQVRIRADDRTLAACRFDNMNCPPAARRFLSIVEVGRTHRGRARLAWVNRAVNMSIRPMSDWAQYGYADYWASPLETLHSQAGDCEDYAILKYIVLRDLGIGLDDLRLVIVRDSIRNVDHAIVAVHYEQEWIVLDNRTMATISAEQARQYQPLFVLDYRGVRTFATASNADHNK
jgi:predicted transglutaminase-like cysteine proteinase